MTVFAPQDIPGAVSQRYSELCELLVSRTVPDVYQRHLHPFKSDPAFYLSPAKAARAAELLASILETLAHRQDWAEDELRAHDTDAELPPPAKRRNRGAE